MTNLYNFLTLQIGMKGLIIKMFAALLIGWYMMSIIGFGVHTCSESGKSFVVAFYEEMTCGEIHPEHSCDEAACCADKHVCHGDCCSHETGHDVLSVKAKSCCSNDYQVLELTGTLVADDDRYDDLNAYEDCPYAALASCEAGFSTSWRTIIKYIQRPDSGSAQARNSQAVLAVWRI